MFQADAGRGNMASVRSTREAISDTAVSYAISDEQGARKKVLDNWRGTAVNREPYGYKKYRRVTGQSSSRFRPSGPSATAEESPADRLSIK